MQVRFSFEEKTVLSCGLIDGLIIQVLSLLVLLVQKYKYWRFVPHSAVAIPV